MKMSAVLILFIASMFAYATGHWAVGTVLLVVSAVLAAGLAAAAW
jgi:hypothetical protein